jgi:uncharacterized protein
MSQWNTNSSLQSGTATRSGVAVDQGLRSYMLGVYNYMAAGVALTGGVAYAFNQFAVQNGKLTDFGRAIYGTPLQWVVMLAPIGIVLYLGVRSHRMSAAWTQGVFWLYAAAVGASLSFILMKYTGMSIARTFFTTAAAFAGLSIFGYTTKRDISGWAAFLWMGLIGVIIASIVQLFVQSPALHFAISLIGLLIFAGFTAYDTQAIKDEYYTVSGYGEEAMAKSSIFGALMLYQDFVGIFTNLLSFMGDRE